MGTGVKAFAPPGSPSSSTSSAPQATFTAATVRTLPTTGMRGGLGRTLLTAFLALTIVPFALIGWYIVAQNRTSLQQEATNKLQLIATLKAENLESWLQARALLFRSALEVTEDAGLAGVSSDFWPAVQRKMPELQGALWSHDARQQVWGECALPEPQAAAPCESFTAAPERRAGAPVAIAFPQAAEMLVLCFDPAALRRGLQLDVALGQTGRVYLVHRDRVWLEDQTAAPATALPEGSCVALAGAAATSAWYANAAEVPVVGAYSPLAGADVGILVEQEQSEVLAPTELIETTVIGGLLSVVLLTTVISALVIRQITRPVIRLTESALEMAAGNLDQHVPVASRDEIGILTYVFNQMAGELKSLYEDLEAKVVARTELLQKANYQIQRRAIQLEASLEVSQAVTSIRDPQALLERVADRIRDCFSYVSVAVYLVEPGGAEAHLHAISPVGVQWPEFVHAGDGTVIGRALRKGSSQLIHEPLAGEEPEWNRRITSYASTPLQMERRVLGVLAVRNAGYESLQEDDVKVLEHLANQVAIALENARAYERERLAAQQLEDNEAFKARFLANMSHELRGPLNSILGFSRLMLKGFDGPLTEEQAADLQRIHSNSQQLLDLINDILTISEIQAGLLDLRYQVVDLRELLLSVLPTASAMIRSHDVQLVHEISPQLAPIRGDPDRIRQVLLHLLSNAAKFTRRGEIGIRAWSDDEMSYVSVRDTGMGIYPQDRERIFSGFEKAHVPAANPAGEGDVTEEAAQPAGAGVGLALCKEFVELHGGQIWLDSEVGKGSTFTFSLPVAETKDARGREIHREF